MYNQSLCQSQMEPEKSFLRQNLFEKTLVLPKTSALAQPYVFLSQDFGAILTEMKAMTSAAISDNI